MIRSSALRKTSVAELLPGDLFRFSYGTGFALALFLERPANAYPKVGVFEGSEFKGRMVLLDFNGGPLECLSYGHNWLMVEEHGAETYCGERETRGKARLYVDDTGLIMAFAAPQGGFGLPIYFDLQSNGLAKLSPSAAPILKWKIWEDENHRDSGNAPLFEAV